MRRYINNPDGVWFDDIAQRSHYDPIPRWKVRRAAILVGRTHEDAPVLHD